MPKDIKPINVPVRFFMWDEEANLGEHHDHGEFVECDEADFIEAEGAIEYERHTVFANGVSQICLTKNPFSNC